MPHIIQSRSSKFWWHGTHFCAWTKQIIYKPASQNTSFMPSGVTSKMPHISPVIYLILHPDNDVKNIQYLVEWLAQDQEEEFISAFAAHWNQLLLTHVNHLHIWVWSHGSPKKQRGMSPSGHSNPPYSSICIPRLKRKTLPKYLLHYLHVSNSYVRLHSDVIWRLFYSGGRRDECTKIRKWKSVFQAAHVLKIKHPSYITYHSNTGRRGSRKDTVDHFFSNNVRDFLTDLGVESSSKHGPKARQHLRKVNKPLRDLNCGMHCKCCLNNETPITFRASYFSIVFSSPSLAAAAQPSAGWMNNVWLLPLPRNSPDRRFHYIQAAYICSLKSKQSS